MRFSNGGMWGRAIYFAKNALYSDKYCSKLIEEKQFFLAEVLLGDYPFIPEADKERESLKTPPFKTA